jgi:hypothetical protein
MILIIVMKDMQERLRMKRRRGSMLDCLCIQRNRVLSHTKLMQDYFAKVLTYLPFLFNRRYLMRPDLFVKIVKAWEENCRYFTRRRNTAR